VLFEQRVEHRVRVHVVGDPADPGEVELGVGREELGVDGGVGELLDLGMQADRR